MSIEATKLKSGRTVYDVRLRDPVGHGYKRTFRTKREAETFEEIVDDLRRGGVRLVGFEPGQLGIDFARDEIVVRVHLIPGLGNREVGSITPLDVQALVNDWWRKQAPNTVRRQYTVLSAVMARAVLSDLIARTPCRGIKLPAGSHVERHIVTADELAALGQALGDDYGLMAYLGAVVGSAGARSPASGSGASTSCGRPSRSPNR